MTVQPIEPVDPSPPPVAVSSSNSDAARIMPGKASDEIGMAVLPAAADSSINERNELARLAGLLMRMRERDQRALGEFYDATLGRVYGIAMRITHDSALAQEVTEDTFLQAWNDADRWDPARGNPLAWLITITRSRALDAIRRKRDQVSLDDQQLDELVDERLDPQAILNAVQAHHAVGLALTRLKPLQRQLIGCAFLRGMTHEEIAACYDMPLGTVKSTIRLALGTLRKVLS